MGITDAFRDASSVRTRSTTPGPGPGPSTTRWVSPILFGDEHALPIFEFTTQLATLEPPPPEMQQLLGAVHGNQEAMDGFAHVNAGVTSPAEFFSDDNIGRIFAAAG